MATRAHPLHLLRFFFFFFSASSSTLLLHPPLYHHHLRRRRRCRRLSRSPDSTVSFDAANARYSLPVSPSFSFIFLFLSLSLSPFFLPLFMTYTPTTRSRMHTRPRDRLLLLLLLLLLPSLRELTDTGDTKNIDHPRDVFGYDAMRERPGAALVTRLVSVRLCVCVRA